MEAFHILLQHRVSWKVLVAEIRTWMISFIKMHSFMQSNCWENLLFSTTGDDKKIVCAFTLANDSIKAALIPNTSRNRIQRKIPNSKRTRSYPAVLIGRLGVAKEFQGTVLSVGSQVIEYIASWFVHPNNKTGCRFIVVDAYNKENVLHFYEKNGFKFLYSTESLEKEANHIPEDECLESRMMYLDLLGYIR